MKRRILSLCCAMAMASALLTTTALAAQNPFTDIASDSTLAQAVLWAYDEGVTFGTSDTEFSPDASCTRGQVVTFLWRSQGEPTPTSNENPFTDVTSDFYYYNAVLWAVEEGITSGTSATEFSPDSTCTTAEVLTFLYRANGEPSKTGEGLYYEDAINWATSNGIAEAVDPDSQSPRSDIVTYLWLNNGAPEVDITDAAEDEIAEEDVAEEVVVDQAVTLKYNMPGDTNLDGQISEAEINAVLDVLRVEYPQGTPWTNDNYYGPYGGGYYSGGYGCAAWAFLVTDAIFGNAPAYKISVDELQVGDYFHTGTHFGVIIAMADNGFYTTEGNFNSSIYWDYKRTTSFFSDSYTYYSRHPQ